MPATFISTRCEGCQAHRFHRVKVLKLDDGCQIRIRICTACECSTRFEPQDSPGLCCRKCGNIRLPLLNAFHRKVGVTVRVRRCSHCGNRMSTSEHVTSASV